MKINQLVNVYEVATHYIHVNFVPQIPEVQCDGYVGSVPVNYYPANEPTETDIKEKTK